MIETTNAGQEARLERVVGAGRNPLHVPGVMHCARCKFVLTRTNLYVGDGTTGPGTNETEPCSNGCGPLWPMTWEQWARDAVATSERFFDEAKKLRAAVKLAYGHLWAINDEPAAPIPLRSCEQASNAARHALRDALTMDERGQAIAEVRALLSPNAQAEREPGFSGESAPARS